MTEILIFNQDRSKTFWTLDGYMAVCIAVSTFND